VYVERAVIGPRTYANFRENNVRGWAAEFSGVVYHDVVVCLEPTTVLCIGAKNGSIYTQGYENMGIYN
jgi:hypothetical protein